MVTLQVNQYLIVRVPAGPSLRVKGSSGLDQRYGNNLFFPKSQDLPCRLE